MAARKITPYVILAFSLINLINAAKPDGVICSLITDENCQELNQTEASHSKEHSSMNIPAINCSGRYLGFLIAIFMLIVVICVLVAICSPKDED